MSFIPFKLKGQQITKQAFDASSLAMTSYAENAEIVGKALAIQCLFEGNAKPANAFFSHSSFKKTDGKLTVRALRLARYLESLTYGYMRIGRDGIFVVAADKKEKTAKRGFYALGARVSDNPAFPVVLYNGRPKAEEVAELVENVHSFHDFENYLPEKSRLSTEMSNVSEATTVKKVETLLNFFRGKELELGSEAFGILVGYYDELFRMIASARGKELQGADGELVKVASNNANGVVKNDAKSRPALYAEIAKLEQEKRVLAALDSNRLLAERDAAQVEAERLQAENAASLEVMRLQGVLISELQSGKDTKQTLLMLDAAKRKLRELAGDAALPSAAPVVSESESSAEIANSSDLNAEEPKKPAEKRNRQPHANAQ